jgi:hypothetical protein
MPKLDVISGCGSGLKPECLADHEGYGLGLSLADFLGGQGATVAPVQHLVSDLMRERGKFLGRLHPGKQRDLPAIRQALGGCDVFGVVECDALAFDELYEAFPVAAHVALDFGQCGEFFAFGLRDVLSRDLRPSLCAPDGSRL